MLSLPEQAVDIGRRNATAVSTDVTPAEIVGHDIHDVGLGRINEGHTTEGLARALPATQSNHRRGVLRRKFCEVEPTGFVVLCFGPMGQQFQ